MVAAFVNHRLGNLKEMVVAASPKPPAVCALPCLVVDSGFGEAAITALRLARTYLGSSTLWFALSCLVVSSGCVTTSDRASCQVRESVHAESGFRHPGILQDKAQLEALRRSMENADALRERKWREMEAEEWATNEHALPAYAEIAPWGEESFRFQAGSQAATRYALQWIVTGNRKYARRAVKTLNTWSETLEKIANRTGDKHPHRHLLAGMNCGIWVNAAELIRCSNAGWEVADQERFERLVREVFLDALEEKHGYNGNWPLATAWSRLAIAVYLDDRAAFEKTIAYLRDGSGIATNGCMMTYLLPSGQNQETARDQQHAQMGLGFLGNACEVAWLQGVDLYDTQDRSMRAALEYQAKVMLGEPVPFEPFPRAAGNDPYKSRKKPSPEGRDKLLPIYNRVYRHYVGRRQQPMPATKRLITERLQPGPEFDLAHPSWGSLLYWNRHGSDSRRRSSRDSRPPASTAY